MKMQGIKNIYRKKILAKIDKDIVTNDGRRAYLRVSVIKDEKKGYIAKVFDRQDSNIFSSLVYSNGLAICPEECKVIKSGEQLEVIILE